MCRLSIKRLSVEGMRSSSVNPQRKRVMSGFVLSPVPTLHLSLPWFLGVNLASLSWWQPVKCQCVMTLE